MNDDDEWWSIKFLPGNQLLFFMLHQADLNILKFFISNLAITAFWFSINSKTLLSDWDMTMDWLIHTNLSHAGHQQDFLMPQYAFG